MDKGECRHLWVLLPEGVVCERCDKEVGIAGDECKLLGLIRRYGHLTEHAGSAAAELGYDLVINQMIAMRPQQGGGA